MNVVRHLPVAEQYPSITSTVCRLASKRISGICGLGVSLRVKDLHLGELPAEEPGDLLGGSRGHALDAALGPGKIPGIDSGRIAYLLKCEVLLQPDSAKWCVHLCDLLAAVCVIGFDVNVVERQLDTLRLSRFDNTTSNGRRNVLPAAFVVTDVSLSHAYGDRKIGLRQAQALSNR